MQGTDFSSRNHAKRLSDLCFLMRAIRTSECSHQKAEVTQQASVSKSRGHSTGECFPAPASCFLSQD
eukprot:764951-Hanusia_phi.AAC.6